MKKPMEYQSASIAELTADAIKTVMAGVESVMTVRTTGGEETAIILKTVDGGSFLLTVNSFAVQA